MELEKIYRGMENGAETIQGNFSKLEERANSTKSNGSWNTMEKIIITSSNFALPIGDQEIGTTLSKTDDTTGITITKRGLYFVSASVSIHMSSKGSWADLRVCVNNTAKLTSSAQIVSGTMVEVSAIGGLYLKENDTITVRYVGDSTLNNTNANVRNLKLVVSEL